VGIRLQVGDLTSEVRDLTLEVGDLTSEVRDLTLEVGDLTSEVRDLTLEVGDLKLEVEELRSPRIYSNLTPGHKINNSIIKTSCLNANKI